MDALFFQFAFSLVFLDESPTEECTDRAGEQRWQEDQVPHQRGCQKRDHHVTEALSRLKRTEGKDAQSQANDSPTLIHGSGTTFIGEHDGLIPT